jgi:hypothetical protein
MSDKLAASSEWTIEQKWNVVGFEYAFVLRHKCAEWISLE